MGKQMEGDNRQRRKAAKQAREEGKKASEVAGTMGASKHRTSADDEATHQQRLDLQRQGKQDQLTENTPEARPGSRDPDSPDRERYPRLSERS